jgi:hypothetical protein
MGRWHALLVRANSHLSVFPGKDGNGSRACTLCFCPSGAIVAIPGLRLGPARGDFRDFDEGLSRASRARVVIPSRIAIFGNRQRFEPKASTTTTMARDPWRRGGQPCGQDRPPPALCTPARGGARLQQRCFAWTLAGRVFASSGIASNLLLAQRIAGGDKRDGPWGELSRSQPSITKQMKGDSKDKR